MFAIEVNIVGTVLIVLNIVKVLIACKLEFLLSYLTSKDNSKEGKVELLILI